MDKYEQDAAEYSDYLEKKEILDAFKGFIVDGTTGLVAGPLKSFIKPKDGSALSYEGYIKGASKGLLGYGYNHLSMAINPKKSAPKAPDMPTASYSEMRYTGEIVGTSQDEIVGPFFIPGSYNESSALSNLDPFNYPAYNVSVGLSALLRTPEPLFFFESQITSVSVTQDYEVMDPDNPHLFDPTCEKQETWRNETSLKMRFDQALEVALNNSLDLDFDRTATYVHVEVRLKDIIPENLNDLYLVNNYAVEEPEGNLFFESETRSASGRHYTYKSEWVLLEDLNQMVFSLDIRNVADITKYGFEIVVPDLIYCTDPAPTDVDYIPNITPSDLKIEVENITLKIAHDYYFDQIGTNGEQVNTTQVFSYLLFQEGTDINFLGDELDWGLPQNNLYNEYIIGEVELGDGLIALGHPAVSGGNNAIVLFIDAQQVLINGDISTPYNSQTALVINALDQIHLEPGAVLRPKHKRLHIKKDFYDVPVFTYTSSTGDFCDTENGGAYLANYASKSLKTRNPENEQSQDQKMNVFSTRKNIDEGVNLFPNPANSQIWISSSSAPISEIQIIDIAGRVLIHEKSANPNVNRVLVNINSLQTGVYIVQTQCGNERSSQKLVVGK